MTETHPEKRLIGYARVSTYGQTLDAQLDQLRAAGCTSRNMYREKATGAHSDRRPLLKMLDTLVPGDVVTVTRIDRLARLMLAVLRGLADVERDLIRTRTAEGRSRAKAQRKHMGGPCPDTSPAEGGGCQTARAGRYAARIGAQLQREPSHDFEADVVSQLVTT
jgi:DNA invertase Pin-like site-specific DNA recombinase